MALDTTFDTNNILYEDDWLVAIDKPAGLLSIQDGYQVDHPNLRHILQQRYGQIWVVHRLDRDTSGIILFAKSGDSHKRLNTLFENHQIQKTYHAIVAGKPQWSCLDIDYPLRVNGDRRHRTVMDTVHGKPAFTIVKVIDSYETASLVEARPRTGYTHQIRAHLALAGFPLLGDTLYMPKYSIPAYSFERTALHAFSITFTHPFTNSLLTITAPYPDDFMAFLNALHRSSHVS